MFIVLIILKIWSDFEPGEAVVVVSCTIKQWSRVGARCEQNLHRVTCKIANIQCEKKLLSYYFPSVTTTTKIPSAAKIAALQEDCG